MRYAWPWGIKPFITVADSTTNAHTHYRKQGYSFLRQTGQNGLSMSWRCGGSAQPAARAMTHSSMECWWRLRKWCQASKTVHMEMRERERNTNLRYVASLVTSLQETADKLREEVSILFQQRFFQLLTHRAAGSRGQPFLQGFTSTAFTKLWEHIGFNDRGRPLFNGSSASPL